MNLLVTAPCFFCCGDISYRLQLTELSMHAIVRTYLKDIAAEFELPNVTTILPANLGAFTDRAFALRPLCKD